MATQKDLLSSFEALSTDDWVKAIEKYLKDKPYTSLFKELEEGVSIAPFYRKEDLSGASAALPLQNNQWLIAERFQLGQGMGKALNAQILHALEQGVNALHIELAAGCQSADLQTALQGVHLQMIATQLDGPGLATQPAAFIDLIASLDADSQGTLCLHEVTTSTLEHLQKQLPNWSGICLELPATDTPAAQLAEVFRQANQHVQVLLEAGFNFAQAQHQLHFHVQVSDDYFVSIARLRALRRLWLAFLEAYEAPKAQYPRVHVATQNTNEDTYWNMISATTQSLSAAVAQVYSIEVTPPDAKASDFARRIARNVQHLLKMESHIDQVIDPSAGSYYIENMTDQLVQQSWTKFLTTHGDASQA